MNPTNPQFINFVRAGLQHWLAQTADESEAHILWLDGERLNLMRVLDYGRELPQLWPQTAQLILQCFTLVERRGYGKEWIPIMRQAADNWAGDDDRLRCQILIRLGYLHQLNCQIDTALTIHRQAEQLAQQLDDLYLFSHTHHNLAIDYREKHQYDQAEFYGQLARSGFVECGDNYRLAITLNDLGLIAQSSGEFNKAHQYLEEAATLFRQSDHPLELLRTLNNLSALTRRENEYNTALSYFEDTRKLFDSISSEIDKIKVVINYGGTLYEMERYDEALAAFHQANSPYLQHSGDTYNLALVAQCLGITLLKLNHPAQAENYVRESLRLWIELGDELMQANTLGTLANLYIAEGMNTDAILLLSQALKLLDRFSQNAWARKLKEKYAIQKKQLENAK